MLLEEFLEDAASHLDAVESSLLQLERDAGRGTVDKGVVTLILGNLHTLKGNSGMMGFTPLQQYVHKLESVFKKGADGNLHLTPPLFSALFTAVNALRESLGRLSENHQAVLDFSDEQMLLDYLLSGEAESMDMPTPVEKKEDYEYITQKSSTLKVNFTKLDDLLNLVGELVIHRTTLLSLESRIKEQVKDRSLLEAFAESSELIGKSAAELREAIMKARMLPAKVVFQRFNRLVRDLSRSHGKEIALVFEGEDTELDKTVIDEIGEPLLHLIRNAVDHGLERSDERRALGKHPQGTITLKAYHESNHIVIAVSDDGRGLSRDGLIASAISKGLIDSRDAASMGEQDAYQLIFHPGFSTSREVTETSGRGIGLDVVKKIATSLNGIIEVTSALGTGTIFTIKLPLTLAIIQALMVEVSGEIYAIPLSGVLESIAIDPAEVHQVADGELIRLRDRLLHINRLNRFFGLPLQGESAQEYVVVVGSGEKQGGLVVDRLLGQQEIVIKGLDDYLGELPGISGGTVLGNGRIALIVDIASLLQRSKGGKQHEGK